MVTVSQIVNLRAPALGVSNYLANFENLPEWDHSVLSVARDTRGTVGVGSPIHGGRPLLRS